METRAPRVCHLDSGASPLLLSYIVTVGIIMQRDDGRKTAVKGNDGGGWSSNGVGALVREEAK
jgi:hypothetical protein